MKTDKDGSLFIELPEQAPDDRVSVIALEVEGGLNIEKVVTF